MSNKFAREHKENTNKITTGAVLCVVGILGATPMFMIHFVIGAIFLFPLFITGMVLVVMGTTKAEKNKVDFKNQYLIPRMREFFSELEYEATNGLQDSTIRELKLIATGDSIHTSDLYKGRYRGCSFIQSDVRCTETKRDSDGDRHTTTVFSGRVIIIGISPIKEGEVKITPKWNTAYKVRKGAIPLNYNHPIVEDFNIFGSSEIELPRYFLDHIVSFKQAFYRQKFYYKILNDRIYIAIDNINELYDVGKCMDTSIEAMDKIIKRDSAFFTNLISLIIDAKNMR